MASTSPHPANKGMAEDPATTTAAPAGLAATPEPEPVDEGIATSGSLSISDEAAARTRDDATAAITTVDGSSSSSSSSSNATEDTLPDPASPAPPAKVHSTSAAAAAAAAGAGVKGGGLGQQPSPGAPDQLQGQAGHTPSKSSPTGGKDAAFKDESFKAVFETEVAVIACPSRNQAPTGATAATPTATAPPTAPAGGEVAKSTTPPTTGGAVDRSADTTALAGSVAPSSVAEAPAVVFDATLDGLSDGEVARLTQLSATARAWSIEEITIYYKILIEHGPDYPTV